MHVEVPISNIIACLIINIRIGTTFVDHPDMEDPTLGHVEMWKESGTENTESGRFFGKL